MNHWRIVAAGEGGQGVQSMAESLARAAYRGGWNALYIPNFGIEQRGGVSLAYVQLSREEIGSPKFITADLVIVLSGRSLQRSRQYIGQRTVILFDNSTWGQPEVEDRVVGLQAFETRAPEALPWGSDQKPEEPVSPGQHLVFPERTVAVPAADLAREKLHPRVFNMIILGAAAALIDAVSLAELRQALEERLSHYFKRDPLLREQNFKGLELGYELAVREKTHRPLLQEVEKD